MKAYLIGLNKTTMLVCTGPNDENGKLGLGLSLEKVRLCGSLQIFADRIFSKGKVLMQGFATKPPLSSRTMVVNNKRPTLGRFEATFNN